MNELNEWRIQFAPRLPTVAATLSINIRPPLSSLFHLSSPRSPQNSRIPAIRISFMMASTSSTSWLSSLLAFCAILCLSVPVNALYFYIDGRQPKCFFEELPKDTLVVGTSPTNCFRVNLLRRCLKYFLISTGRNLLHSSHQPTVEHVFR